MQHAEGFLKLVEAAKRHIRELTLSDVLELRKRGHLFHFVDVREDDEWAQGRAQGGEDGEGGSHTVSYRFSFLFPCFLI